MCFLFRRSSQLARGTRPRRRRDPRATRAAQLGLRHRGEHRPPARDPTNAEWFPWRPSIPGRTTESGPTVDPERLQRAGEREPGGWRQFPMPWLLPGEPAVNTEVRYVINVALARLPGPQRVVMELRDLQGHDGQEVADLLSVTIGNQRVLLRRTRAPVCRELETCCPGRQR